MFTGIIQGQAKITAIVEKPSLKTLTVDLTGPFRDGLLNGASVSIDGVCLTVTELSAIGVSFDVMLETLNLTTLGSLSVGDLVNIERSAHEGKEVGGHILSGHVDGTAVVSAVETPENNRVITFQAPKRLMRYIFSKGFIALNGASLTVVNADKRAGTFQVWFIPETLRITTFASKRVDDRINIEIDRSTQVIVDTVTDFLKEHINEIIPTAANG